MTAVAYLRRSSGEESPLSREAQEQAVLAIAAQRGDTIARTFVDWGRSGSDRQRPGFLEMLDAIAAKRVSAVYCYDSDRLARRTATLGLLLDAAAENGTAIVDRHGRDLAGRDRLIGEVMGALDGEVLRKIVSRNRENTKRRQDRGDVFGPVPYGHRREWVCPVGCDERKGCAQDGDHKGAHFVNVPTIEAWTPLNAYVAAGSARGAAGLLNAFGIETVTGTSWKPATVHRIVSRMAPDLFPPRFGRQKRQPLRIRPLSGLVRCYCGGTMTVNGTGSWCCPDGGVGVHPRPHHVSDRLVLAWARDEAARLTSDILGQTVQMQEERGEARAALLERKRRAGVAFADGYLTDEEYAARVKAADKALAILDDEDWGAVQELPEAVDWGADPEVLNGLLRFLWPGGIRCDLIDGKVRPVEAGWRHPEWRSDDPV